MSSDVVVSIAVNSQVRRRSTGEFGVVLALDRDQCEVMFASSGQATLHISDLEPAPTDPASKLREGQVAPHPEYPLRLQARYLQHAYKYDELSGLSNARVEPQLHQVFVAHRVSRKLRPRMILADEVGLGKTIEAGLIIKEQIARGLVDRILIACPASLQYQWLYEMQSKFNEEFTIIDGPTARMLERDGSNPWTKVDRVITSVQFARREDRALQIVDADWDLVVFDEAHHVRRRYEGPDRYRTTQAYRLADELKELVDGMLLLTATPMQLHPFELYSLIELVEPGLYPSFEAYDLRRQTLPKLNSLMHDLQRWETLDQQEKAVAVKRHESLFTELGVRRDPTLLEEMSVRERLMDDLVDKHPLSQTLVRNRKTVVGGFTSRKAQRIPVTLGTEEDEVYQEVSRYIAEGYNRARQDKNNAVGFLMVLYQKMLSSSSNALRASFQKRVLKLTEQLERADAFARGELTEEDLEALVGGEELEDAIDALEQIAINREEAEWEISVLKYLVERLGGLRDSKAEKLVYELVEPLLRDRPHEKVLVFTGFIQTQEFLRAALESAGYKVVIFNGRMNLEEKEAAVRRFRTSAQIMVTTEAGGEGRNFQFAHILVNYDLPWNPMVVEQRIGRLDRIGQKKEVLIYNLVCEGTVEDRILEVLDNRIGLFEESVGSLDPILGEVERNLERLIMEHAASLDREIEHYGKDLERRVREARERERVLADFILDRASLRRDEALELLGEDPLAKWSDLRDFVGDALSYYGGRLSPHTEGGYSLSLSPNLSHRLGIKRGVTQGEFNPAAALEAEDLPFFAFGHEAIDAVVAWAANRDAVTGARLVSYTPPGWSVEIIYELESQGVRPSGKLVRHLIGPDLVVNEEQLTSMPELGLEVAMQDLDWMDKAISLSREQITHALSEARSDAQKENEENRKEELERAKRIYQYQRDRLERVIEEMEAWIRAAEAGGTEGERRVLPARRGRLNRDRERLRALQDTHKAQAEQIRNRVADVVLRVVAAGLVKGS